MAYVELLRGVRGNVLLNNGTTQTGAVRTITQSLGTLDYQSWDYTKIANIANALAPIFDKGIYQVQGVKTFIIDNE